MNTKTLFSMVLLGFVAVSITFAVRKVAPEASSNQEQTAALNKAGITASPVGLNAKLAESQYSAVYFHAPHRCPTCRMIESFSHEALTPEIEAGNVAWQIADYTADDNASLVDQFKVFTSTVVLVEVQDGHVVRWKNLEEVWNHTSDQAEFTAFINQSWRSFQEQSDSKLSQQAPQLNDGVKLLSANAAANELVQFGTMHEAIGEQKSEGRVAIASLVEKPNFYGVGALEQLEGEITIFDSQAVVSVVNANGQIVPSAEDVTSMATMLAGSYVQKWNETALGDIKNQQELEDRIQQYATESGLDTSKAFGFTVSGQLAEIEFHVINGQCPMHAKIHGKPIVAGMQPAHTKRKDIEAKLVGIFAKNAAGKLTHPGTKVHLHVIYTDEQGCEKTGHVESLVIGDNATLRVPMQDATQ